MLRPERVEVTAREGDDEEEFVQAAEGDQIFPDDEVGLGWSWFTGLQAGIQYVESFDSSQGVLFIQLGWVWLLTIDSQNLNYLHLDYNMN